MLSWETTLWQDFKNLFGLSQTSANTLISTTSSMVSTSSADNTGQSALGMEVGKFQDAEFDNEDCRVIKDASGNIIFLYSIIDQNTIVITTSPATLNEIVSRIHAAATVTQ
jgi:hypothetical protein